MATLINGDGNAAVYAQQDADWFQAIMGSDKSLILDVGLKMAYEIEDANTIAVKNGVILTKEGRRIQIDVGSIDEFTIPTGEQGVTNYYIIGFHLYTDGSSKQLCETFVEKMNNATDTIPEATFRGGATEVYVSLYRVTQIGFAIDSASLLLEYGSGIGAINASLTELEENETFRYNEETDYLQCKVDGVWTNYMKANMKVYRLFADGSYQNSQGLGNQVAQSGWTGAGNWSITEGRIVVPSSNVTNCIGGNFFQNAVDVTNYNKFVAVDHNGNINELDISGISGNRYLAIYSKNTGSGSYTYLGIGATATTQESSLTKTQIGSGYYALVYLQ